MPDGKRTERILLKDIVGDFIMGNLLRIWIMKLWLFVTKKERDLAYADHIKRLSSGEQTIKNRVRNLIRSEEDVSCVVMSFKTYQRWHMEENIEDGVTIYFGRKLEIDGIPIKIDNTVGDYVEIR